MAVRGIVMRMVQPREGSKISDNDLSISSSCPNVEASYTFEGQDDLSPQYNTVYFLSDITPVLESSSFFEEDQQQNSEIFSSIAWEVCAFLNGRDTIEAKELSDKPHLLPKAPAIGSTLVSNGGTPPAGGKQDYNDWYELEHSAMLSIVPGWNNCRRYRHEKTYGQVDIASFYGWNYYDAANGLGGPEWQASLYTEWTQRVRENAAKPNLRRVWKVIKTSKP